MEPSRFDDLTKALATATSRREALKTIAATTLAGLLGLGGIGTAFAKPKCHRAGLGCDTDSNCCQSQCLTCQDGKCASTCTSGQTCQNGQCVATCVPDGGPCTADNPGACCSQICCIDVAGVPPNTCCF